MDRIIKFTLLAIGFSLFTALFVFSYGDVDMPDITWRLILLKLHLSQELSIPYFTPGRCGGFLLAADAQDLMFSLYALFYFLIPQVVLAIKVTTYVLSIIFAVGFYKWLSCFGLKDQNARIFASILVTISGYWICHMVVKVSVWAHGLAYLPWIMYYFEYFLKTQPRPDRPYLLRAGLLALLFFLLINSGYYWLQVAVPIIVIRGLVELVLAGRNLPRQLPRLFIVGAIFLFAIILSLPRLGAIFEFQLANFPRRGGAVEHIQIIGGKPWKNLMLGSLFESSYLTHKLTSEYIGPYYEYNNFIGALSLIFIFIGLSRIFTVLRTKAGIGLFLAGWFQACLTRDVGLIDWIRSVLPIYNQITWYWRGHIIFVLFLCVIVALGYELLLRNRRQWVKMAVLVLMVWHLGEMTAAYSKLITLNWNPLLSDAGDTTPPVVPCESHFAPCKLGNIYGVGNNFPRELSYVPIKSVYDSSDPKYYNMHDIRRLMGPEARGGYYVTHSWPLWPKTDAEEFEKFIRYKQVIPVPARLRVMNMISGGMWLFYLGGMVIVFLRKNWNISERITNDH